MITVKVDFSQLKNELTQIHEELHQTQTADDNTRRDVVNRVIEKLRTLRNTVESGEIEVQAK